MSGEQVERRLAAILAADVAGYSRLMGADEEGTSATLRACRREFLDLKIAEHRGRIVKTTGDGFLIEFASVVDATRCAVELQHGLRERNNSVPQDKRLEFRIGINVGDVIVEDNDIFGDGVNVAGRLEGLAEPGGIVISAIAHDAVINRVEAEFRDLGELSEGIARRVRAFSSHVRGQRIAQSPLARFHDTAARLARPSDRQSQFDLSRFCLRIEDSNFRPTGWRKTSPHCSRGYPVFLGFEEIVVRLPQS